jgi:hypothetical protein
MADWMAAICFVTKVESCVKKKSQWSEKTTKKTSLLMEGVQKKGRFRGIEREE